jgi:RNA recognition motif-containing protein
MSVRLYVGNLPSSFDVAELEGLLAGVAEGVRFKPVHDRETGACRGFGFASVEDPKLAETLIAQLNGREFAGQPLRVEISERRDSRGTPERRGTPAAGTRNRPSTKVIHADQAESEAPDPRWAGELAKLKSLLANQKVGV